jgi:hypothetical protein
MVAHAAPTKQQIDALISMIRAVGDAIRELGSVPSGHLYARLCGHLDINSYQKVIDALIGAKLVRRDESHLLTWIGPKS